MGDYSDWVNYIDDGYIDDTVIWSVRDQLTPPEKDYVMWSSSGWETNIEHLIEDMGLEEDEIRLVRYSGHTSNIRFSHFKRCSIILSLSPLMPIRYLLIPLPPSIIESSHPSLPTSHSNCKSA